MTYKKKRKFVPVSCVDCGCEWLKREDSLKSWLGRCRSCNSIRVGEMPHIKEFRSKAASKQVERMGGIPNGNRFDSSYSGEAHWNWRGGITNQRRLEMGKAKYIEWRTSVFERDDYTCQACGKRGGWLDADHILPWSTHEDLRYEVSNGRTLCRPCHIETPTYGMKARRYADATPSTTIIGV